MPERNATMAQLRTKLTIPHGDSSLFHSPSAESAYRGLALSLIASIEVADGGIACPSLDLLVNDEVHGDPLGLLSGTEADFFWTAFTGYFYGPDEAPLDDAWFALLEKALDRYIDKHGIVADPKEGV